MTRDAYQGATVVPPHSSGATSRTVWVSFQRYPLVAVVPLEPGDDKAGNAGEHDGHADHPMAGAHEGSSCCQAAYDDEESQEHAHRAQPSW